jgi:hypothetical protein
VYIISERIKKMKPQTKNIIFVYGESWDFPRMPIAWKEAPTIQRIGVYNRPSEWIPEGKGGWVQFFCAQTPERLKEIAELLSSLPLNDYDSL